jgi:hypothetical protein
VLNIEVVRIEVAIIAAESSDVENSIEERMAPMVFTLNFPIKDKVIT